MESRLRILSMGYGYAAKVLVNGKDISVSGFYLIRQAGRKGDWSSLLELF